MKLPAVTLPAVNRTPVGASSQAALVTTLVLGVLDSNLPWWHQQSPDVKYAASAVVLSAVTYLAGWLKVVLARGQAVSLRLTASPLPTVEAAPPPPAPPPPASQ